MITLQIDAKRMSDIIKTIQAEINKNPDGFINIDFTSAELFVPAFSWTPELGIPSDDYDFVKIKKEANL